MPRKQRTEFWFFGIYIYSPAVLWQQSFIHHCDLPPPSPTYPHLPFPHVGGDTVLIIMLLRVLVLFNNIMSYILVTQRFTPCFSFIVTPCNFICNHHVASIWSQSDMSGCESFRKSEIDSCYSSKIKKENEKRMRNERFQ